MDTDRSSKNMAMAETALETKSTARNAARPCPYVGLQYFDVDNADLFFGRAGQSDDMVRKLAQRCFLAVVGTSGSGKSSLIRGGLFPSLLGGYLGEAGAHWRFAEMSPGRDPLARLSSGLSAAGMGTAPSKEELRADCDAIAKWFAKWAASRTVTRTEGDAPLLGQDGLPATTARPQTVDAPSNAPVNLLILADQFEELFRYHVDNSTPASDREEKAFFVQHLLAAVRQSKVPIYVVIGMRSEYLGECARYRDLAEEMNESQYLIPRLSRAQRRQAIEGPLKVAGSSITSKATQRILNDCGDDPDQLPLMQHALMRMWDTGVTNGEAAAGREKASHRFDLDDYLTVGGIANALSKHANEIYRKVSAELGPRGDEIFKRIFLLFYDRDEKGRETRHLAKVSELMAVTEASFDQVAKVVTAYTAQGSVFLRTSTEPLQMGTEVEVIHECVLRKWDTLRDKWMPEEDESKRIYLELAQRATQPKPDYLTGATLRAAQEWWDERDPTTAWANRYHPGFNKAREFLKKSLRSERWTKRLRYVLPTAVILAVLALFGLYKFRIFWQDATAQTLADRSANLLRDNDNLLRQSFLLAAASLDLEGDPSVAASISSSLHLLPSLLPPLTHPHVNFLAYSADGKYLASGDDGGTVLVWENSAQVNKVSSSGNLRALTWADNLLLVGGDGGGIRVFSAQSPAVQQELPCPDLGGERAPSGPDKATKTAPNSLKTEAINREETAPLASAHDAQGRYVAAICGGTPWVWMQPLVAGAGVANFDKGRKISPPDDHFLRKLATELTPNSNSSSTPDRGEHIHDTWLDIKRIAVAASGDQFQLALAGDLRWKEQQCLPQPVVFAGSFGNAGSAPAQKEQKFGASEWKVKILNDRALDLQFNENQSVLIAHSEVVKQKDLPTTDFAVTETDFAVTEWSYSDKSDQPFARLRQSCPNPAANGPEGELAAPQSGANSTDNGLGALAAPQYLEAALAPEAALVPEKQQYLSLFGGVARLRYLRSHEELARIAYNQQVHRITARPDGTEAAAVTDAGDILRWRLFPDVVKLPSQATPELSQSGTVIIQRSYTDSWVIQLDGSAQKYDCLVLGVTPKGDSALCYQIGRQSIVELSLRKPSGNNAGSPLSNPPIKVAAPTLSPVFSNDGNFIAIDSIPLPAQEKPGNLPAPGSFNRELHIFDVSTGKDVRVVPWSLLPATGSELLKIVGFSVDNGSLILQRDKELMSLEVQSNQPPKKRTDFMVNSSLVLSPGGKYLAVVDADALAVTDKDGKRIGHIVRIFDTSNWKEIANSSRWNEAENFNGVNQIRWANFSPEGQYLTLITAKSITGKGTLTVWDWGRNEIIAQLLDSQDVTQATITAQDHKLLVLLRPDRFETILLEKQDLLEELCHRVSPNYMDDKEWKRYAGHARAGILSANIKMCGH